jgi:SAM-dependent methyltransferase
MTHRFAELYGRVIALAVSDEMLRLSRRNLAGVGNVEWVLGSGTDLDVLADRSVGEVFSYITLQHVPTSAVVLRYLEEAGRVLRPGGRGALQVRHPGPLPWAVDLAGHLVHAAQGRRVWSGAWRGTRIPTHRLFQAASRPEVRVELRPRGHRHLVGAATPLTLPEANLQALKGQDPLHDRQAILGADSCDQLTGRNHPDLRFRGCVGRAVRPPPDAGGKPGQGRAGPPPNGGGGSPEKGTPIETGPRRASSSTSR